MKRCLMVSLLFFSLNAFSQKKSKKFKENEQRILLHLDSLDKAGAFARDSLGINKERIESYANFPGGVSAWSKYIVDNFPMELLTEVGDRGMPKGTYPTWIEFTVYEDGSVGDFRSITNFGYGLEQGFIKIIKETGPWIPAKTNGKAISSRIKWRQVFELLGDD